MGPGGVVDPRRATRSWAFWSFAALWCLTLMVHAATGSAAEFEPEPEPEAPAIVVPACPAAPAAYEGESEVAAELRALRIDQVQACEVTKGGVEVLAERLFWNTSELRHSRQDSGQENIEVVTGLGAITHTNELLSERTFPVKVEPNETGPIGVTIEGGGTGGEGGEAGTVVAAVEDSTTAIETQGGFMVQAIFVLIGVLLGLFIVKLFREVLGHAA